MKTNTYAGIGSRITPPVIMALMFRIATRCAHEAWICRSGGARGADTAFWDGATSINDKLFERFLPWPGYNGLYTGNALNSPTDEAFTIAAAHHPAWARCTHGARKLHARNAHIILGANLTSPVRCVICWTPDGKDSGGTGLGIRIARTHGIQIYNLHDPETEKRFRKKLDAYENAAA